MLTIATMLAELDYETKGHHLTVENVATGCKVPLDQVLFAVTQLGKRHLIRVLGVDVEGKTHHSVELIVGKLDESLKKIRSKNIPTDVDIAEIDWSKATPILEDLGL